MSARFHAQMLIVFLLFAALALAPRASAQCTPHWLPGGGRPGVDARVVASAIFDADGAGPGSPLLVVGGDISIAGSAATHGLAAWDGIAWSDFGLPADMVSISAIATADSPTGAALYVAGKQRAEPFDRQLVLRRVVGGWEPVGTAQYRPPLTALAIDPSSASPRIYAAGFGANSVICWDGQTWTPLEAGPAGNVFALLMFDDGDGAALFAGGDFAAAGGVPAANIAKWDGSAWSALGSGLTGEVFALAAFDDGEGLALFVGGAFTDAGAVETPYVARWDGAAWSALGTGTDDVVRALAPVSVAGDAALYVGGDFSVAGGQAAARVARWDGAAWRPLGGGIPNLGSVISEVNTIAVPPPAGPGGDSVTYVGGYFAVAGSTPADNIATWDGEEWSRLSPGTNGRVFAFAVLDPGDEPTLHAAGSFTTISGVDARRVARWGGGRWNPVGSGLNNSVLALATFDDGGGSALYAGGRFQSSGGPNRVARLVGENWRPLGSGPPATFSPALSEVRALATFDDGSGPALYVGGFFDAIAGQPLRAIARWDGLAWSPVGAGLADGSVDTLTVYDDGSGPALYAGGSFTRSGATPLNHVGRWDGVSWSRLASGADDDVLVLRVLDDGNGDALFAGGRFTAAGGIQGASRIARWDSQGWSPLGAGVSGGDAPSVSAITAANEPGGWTLYAAGRFAIAGTVEARNIARWRDHAWSALDGGADDAVYAAEVFTDGGGPALFIGGAHNAVGGSTSVGWARRRCPFGRGDVNCDGVVNFFDIDPFLLTLFDPPGYSAAWPLCDPRNADVNGDDAVNFFDIDPFVSCLLGACP